jgi:two-component system nitrate/nitrite response regulator NarL
VARLAVCDDHQLLRDTLAYALEAHGHEVVARWNHPAEGIEPPGRLPEVLLVDLHYDAAEAEDPVWIEALRTQYPDAAVVVVTAERRADVLGRAVTYGAHAIVFKGEDLSTMLSTIEDVRRGKTSIPTAVLAAMLRPRPDRRAPVGARFLTEKEIVVLRLLAQGSTTAALAEELGIRATTVRTHVQNILNKLGVHSKLEAVTKAIAVGLVDPPR